MPELIANVLFAASIDASRKAVLAADFIFSHFTDEHAAFAAPTAAAATFDLHTKVPAALTTAPTATGCCLAFFASSLCSCCRPLFRHSSISFSISNSFKSRVATYHDCLEFLDVRVNRSAASGWRQQRGNKAKKR